MDELEQLKDAYHAETDPELKAVKRAHFLTAMRPLIEQLGSARVTAAFQKKKAEAIAGIRGEQAASGGFFRGMRDAVTHPMETIAPAGQYVQEATLDAGTSAYDALSPYAQSAKGAFDFLAAPQQVKAEMPFGQQAQRGVTNLGTAPFRVAGGMAGLLGRAGEIGFRVAGEHLGTIPKGAGGGGLQTEDYQALAALGATAINPLFGLAAWSAPAIGEAVGTASVEGPKAIGEAALTQPEAFGLGLPYVAKAGTLVGEGARALFRRNATGAAEAGATVTPAATEPLAQAKRSAAAEIARSMDAEDPQLPARLAAIEAATTPEEIAAAKGAPLAPASTAPEVPPALAGRTAELSAGPEPAPVEGLPREVDLAAAMSPEPAGTPVSVEGMGTSLKEQAGARPEPRRAAPQPARVEDLPSGIPDDVLAQELAARGLEAVPARAPRPAPRNGRAPLGPERPPVEAYRADPTTGEITSELDPATGEVTYEAPTREQRLAEEARQVAQEAAGPARSYIEPVPETASPLFTKEDLKNARAAEERLRAETGGGAKAMFRQTPQAQAAANANGGAAAMFRKAKPKGPGRQGKLFADPLGLVAVADTVAGGARALGKLGRGVVDFLRPLKAPAEPAAGATPAAAEEARRFASGDRARLEQLMRQAGRDPVAIDSLDDGQVREKLGLYHRRLQAMHPEAAEVLGHEYHLPEVEVPTKGVGLISALITDPAQPGNAMRDVSLKTANVEAGRADFSRRVKDFVIGDQAGMTETDHQAVFHEADGTATPADTALIAKNNLQPVVDRIRQLGELAMADPRVEMTGAVEGPYITRAGLARGWLGSIAKGAEREGRGYGSSNPLEKSRALEELPREMTAGVDVGNQMSYYGRALFDQIYSKKFYRDWQTKATGNPSDFTKPVKGSYAAENPFSFWMKDRLIRQSIGNVQHASDALTANTVRAIVNSPGAKAIGSVIGRLPLVGMKAREVGAYLAETQRPVSDLVGFLAKPATVSGVGFNPKSVGAHIAGDLPGLMAKAIRHPIHFAGAVAGRLFSRDPAFNERMYKAGLWDRDMRWSELTKVVGNQSLVRQGAQKIGKLAGGMIAMTDGVFKGLTVKLGERTGLQEGLSPDAAFQRGLDLARGTQNAFSRSNTSPLLADPVMRAMMMFSRAPKRFITSPLAHLMAGEPLEAAAIPGAAAALYLMGKAAGINLLPTMIHGRNSKQDSALEALVPLTIVWDDLRKVAKLATGEVPFEGMNTDPRALPTSFLRRTARTYQEGDPAHNLLGLHEDLGDDWDNAIEAAGQSKMGNFLRGLRDRSEEDSNDGNE